jgi:excinuclease ABC subunit A
MLPDVWITCESCKGTRYVPETLAVRYHGRSIADVLDMSIAEALGLFSAVPKVRRMLQTLDDVGLGYLQLGQAAPTLSGGEAQRVKLAAELGRPQTGKTVYILDEPTTGLHFDDLKKLLAVLHRLVDLGNTCICIEHNLDVIKTADWVIDLGPEAGEAGGTVVVEGTPETVAQAETSHTGKALRPILEAGPLKERQVFDPERAAAQQEDLRKRIDLGDEVKMPWQIDGERWHTVDHVDRKGQPVRWESGFLRGLVETIESAGQFAPTDWNDRARIEIRAKGKGQWFCHILTGGTDLLDILIRIPKGTFTAAGLRQQVNIKTLDERTDLPIYGQWKRAQLRPRSADWDEIRLSPRDTKDISKRAFARFIKTAAGAYLDHFEAESASPEKREPWKTNGQAWHVSQRSITAHHRVRWRPALLMALIGRFKKLQPDLKVDWSAKVVVSLSVPGEAKPAGRIVTNMGQGLRVELRTPSALFTPTQVEGLGLEPQIKQQAGYDRIVFWLRSLDNCNVALLADIWKGCRKAMAEGRLQPA